MYYSLNNDVFIVDGEKKSCIYDLSNSKLYSINNLLAEKIHQVNRGKIDEKDVEPELKSIFDDFIIKGIFILTETPIYHDISDIKEKKSDCQFAWIEITTKCNLKCIHCYNESDIRCDNVMSFETFQYVIDILVNMKVPKIQLIGGEPFFDKKLLKKMLDYVIGKFEYIEVFTNGTLITDSWFNYLAHNNIRMALSVYSYDEQMHDNVTGIVGSWTRTNSTINNLKKYGIPYRICNVLMKGIDIGEKNNDLYNLSEEKDVVRMSGRGNFSLLSDELIKKRLITKISFQKPIKKVFCKRLISGHNCFKDKIYISANLDVFPCVMERRIKHCTINNGKITLDDNIRYLTKDKINGCSKCEYRYACFDCRPNSLSGEIFEKPWYCTYHPENGEWENEDEFIARLRENVKNS